MLSKQYHKTLDFLFFITGGKFYLNWLLVTNPASRNPIFRFVFKPLKLIYGTGFGFDLYKRFTGAILFGTLHVVLIFSTQSLILNILVNIYPIWTQVYIGSKCFRVMRHQKRKARIETLGNYPLTTT